MAETSNSILQKLDGLEARFEEVSTLIMFGTLDRSWRPFTEADHALSARMLDAWTDFCKFSNPGWPAYKQDAPFKQEFDVE